MTLDPRVPDLTSLDLLLSVSELGSLGQAARARGISEPAASVRIRRLERQMGLQLLDRSRAGSTPTTAGGIVIDWARTVVASANQLAVSIAALRGETGGRLVVAASMTVAEYLMPQWLLSLRTAASDVAIALRVGNSAEVAALVSTGAAAIGFIETPREFDGLHATTVARDALVVIVPPDHVWAKPLKPVTLADLTATRLVMREEGSGTRDTLGQAMVRRGLELRPGLTLGSTTAIKTAVALGEGVGVLSELAVVSDVRDGRLMTVPLVDADLSRSIQAIWPSGHPAVGAAAALLAITQTHETAKRTGSQSMAC